MKTITFFLILLITGSSLLAQTPPNLRPLPRRPALRAQTPAMPAPASAAPAQNNSSEEMIPPGLIDFQGVDVSQVLEVYAQLVGRTLLRAGLPNASIVLKTETPLTKSEAIEALQAVLALNGIAVINVGDKFVKVVPVDQANTTAAPFNDVPVNQLPELGSYVTRIVQLKYVKPSEMVPIIQPFAKLPNSILPIDSNGILVLRDDAENVKRMMEMIDKVDVSVPAEYISDVIPIKYAMVDDIANALNSLSGSGSGTVAVGSSTTPSGVNAANGIVRPNGSTGNNMGLQNGNSSNSSFNQNNSTFGSRGNQTSAGASPFASRLSAILNHVQQGAGGQEQPIQIIGQTKIIADERSNSLLVYATRADMATIKDIVSKLDVLLAQVLIESVIMDVSMGNGWNFGVSVAQNQINAGNNQNYKTIGGINNGQPFYNFLQSATGSNSFPGNLTSVLPGSGLSYFGDIGPNWDVALQAAANDNSVTVIQRPRIQTSQAKEAQFFVGSTVPYVTSVYYDSGIGGGPSSSYSQLQVGISLDVTPFINPDGLVVMDINQEIDDISGSVTVQGVGDVPTTDKRTLSSEVAVKDKDTIILGGFVRDDKTKSRSGIPLLEDIPFIGNLFSSRTSQKDRDELIVLMRPTVLRTPEIAAAQTIKEEDQLPGIMAAQQEDLENERKAKAAERKRERIEKGDGDFIAAPDADQMVTNAPPVIQ